MQKFKVQVCCLVPALPPPLTSPEICMWWWWGSVLDFILY